jgi:hypothetical protein
MPSQRLKTVVVPAQPAVSPRQRVAKATLLLRVPPSAARLAKTARPEAQTATTTVTVTTIVVAETATVVAATVTATVVAALDHRTSQSQRSPRMTY